MKKLVLIVIAVLALGGGIYLAKPHQSVAPTDNALVPVSPEIAGQPIVMSDYVRYPGRDGKNALELLQGITKVESKEYSFGVFVESINGVKPDKDHFWKLYLNGQEAQVGAKDLKTHKGDVIEWKVEELKK